MHARSRVLAIGLVFLISAAAASADTVTIKYTISSGHVTVDAAFPITSGTFSVSYESVGSVPISGPAVLNTFALAASGLSISGDFHDLFVFQLDNPLAGVGATNSIFVNNAPLNMAGNIDLHCLDTPYYCSYYGFVVSVPKNFPLLVSGNTGILGINGAVLDVGLVNYRIVGSGGGYAVIHAVGQEIERIVTVMDSVTITNGPAGAPNPVASGGTVAVSVTAVDSLAHTLFFSWSADCPTLATSGLFDDPALANPQWNAPVNLTGSEASCSIDVVVSDGFGFSDNGSYVQLVPEPNPQPMMISALAVVLALSRFQAARRA